MAGTLQVNVGGSWHNAKPFVNVAGSWRTVQNGYVNVGGSWRQFFQALTNVTASGPGSVSGNFTAPSGTTGVASASATVTASGGTGSYTYTWSRVSGSTAMTLSGGSTATAAFSESHIVHALEFDDSAVYQCAVSDGHSSATVTVNVALSWTSNS